MVRRLALLAAIVWLAGCQASLPAAPARQPFSQLELVYIGQQVLPSGYQYRNTTVGGLSGIDYDPNTRRYWTISDDRSEREPARFYELLLDLAQFNNNAEPGQRGVAFHSVSALKRQDRLTFPSFATDPANATDPESIRLHAPSGHLVWSSEGERAVAADKPAALVEPHVWQMERDGRFARALGVPSKFRPTAGTRGIRRNLGFEGLAFSADYGTLYVALENALLQDGPAASLTSGSPTRIIEYDFPSGLVRAEYVVEVAPIPFAPTQADGFADNGISEILALDRDRLLVMERSFAAGVGNTIRLFDVDLRGATNVADIDALTGQSFVPAAKRPVLDLAELKIRLDNLEGMSWGPRLPNGNRTLILVSDDNFNPRQITLFLAFEVRER